jgi:hypothetical protein
MPPFMTDVLASTSRQAVDTVNLAVRGAGLRQSAQTFGAIVGASIAAATFRLSGSNYIATFALSAIPAAIAFLVVSLVSCNCLQMSILCAGV